MLCVIAHFYLFYFHPIWPEVETDRWRNGGKNLIAVTHRGKDFDKVMERFQEK